MDPDPRRRPLECTACPGDVLFVPHGWWHLVLNIGDTDADSFHDGGMSVALTRNYVSASNLSDVLRFLDTRVGQISGCRDRGEAIQPKALGAEFRKALRFGHSSPQCDTEEKKENESGCTDASGKWADLLEKAEIDAKNGWRCAAWTDVSQGESCTILKKEKGKGIRTSILEKAKLTNDENRNNDSGVIARPCEGFSFSFL